jgi:hypothetical protein
VGYYIGQERIAKHDTELLFNTCGMLLEELRTNGLEALEKYKVVVIDEVHERSAESDLVRARHPLPRYTFLNPGESCGHPAGRKAQILEFE